MLQSDSVPYIVLMNVRIYNTYMYMKHKARALGGLKCTAYSDGVKCSKRGDTHISVF